MTRAEVGLGYVVAFVVPRCSFGGGVLVRVMRVDAWLTKAGVES